MKKIVVLLLLLIPTVTLASDITKSSTININNTSNNKLVDNNENTYITINKNTEINISNNENIYGIYIIYELSSQQGTISNENNHAKIGENNFLHEYIPVDKLIGSSKNINISYDNDVKIGEIYVLGEGEIPEYVEVWNPSCDEADLLLFSTHSDDEQLFFLGLLPTYVAKGASVQVVYFTNHLDNPKRLHEQLHGLYTVGIRNYPVMGIIPDAYSESLDGAIKNLNKANLTIDDAIKFEVEMIRRFKPLVVVGHDENGEYSHGQHILNTHVLKIALEKSNNKDEEIDSYQKYGVWEVKKTYLHLYKENQIIMDYDTPLDYFNGKTAYEVSKEGYSKHLSQQWTWFTSWINGKNNEYTKATDIKTYSPLEYGLYKTTVGLDVEKNDMFENLTFRKDEINNNDDIELDSENNIIIDEENNNFNYKIVILMSISIILIFIAILGFKKRKR